MVCIVVVCVVVVELVGSVVLVVSQPDTSKANANRVMIAFMGNFIYRSFTTPGQTRCWIISRHNRGERACLFGQKILVASL